MISAPLVPWTQWAGQMGISYDSVSSEGLDIVKLDSKAFFGGEWDVAKETWSEGWASFVAILMANGKESRLLMRGATSRPPSIAKVPFY